MDVGLEKRRGECSVMNKIALFLVVVMCGISAFGQQIGITNKSMVIIPPVVMDTTKVAIWRSNTVYAVGDLVKTNGAADVWVAAVAGTSSNSMAALTGVNRVSDGTVTWAKTRNVKRNGVVIHILSGGRCSVQMGAGYFELESDEKVSFMDASYQGSVIVTSTTNLIGYTVW